MRPALLAAAIACLWPGTASAQPEFAETHRAGARFAFEAGPTPQRVLRFDGLSDGGQAQFRLPECFVGSSETGAFAYLDEVQDEPFVVAICGTLSDDRSLYIFAPERDRSAPVYALLDKPDLSMSLRMVGLSLIWRGPDGAFTGGNGAIWEAPRTHFASARFRDARDRAVAVGQIFAVEGRLPEGLEGEAYFLAVRPDTPLRLGPSPDAPYFQRLADRVLIHAPDPEVEPARPVWRVGGWLRVCIVDGGCGYVPEESVRQAGTRESATPN